MPKRPEVAQAEDQVFSQMGEDLPLEGASKAKEPPAWQSIGHAAIRVSKAFGKNVERRKQAAINAMEIVRQAWDEAYRYYNHNQVRDDVFKSQVRPTTFRQGDSYENLVFSNTSVMIPAIYSKNPDVAFSTDQAEDKEFVNVLSKAVNAVFNKKSPRGINLKPRMKKAALHAELTNLGVIKLDYISKDSSLEKAQTDMDGLFERLEKAEDIKTVQEIEGQMMALETNMEWMEPSGFKLSIVLPTNLIIDPCAENEDASDANWLLEETYIATNFLNAKFTKKDDNERVLLYKPTHRIKTDGVGSREDALGLVLEAIEEGVEAKKGHTDDLRQSYIYQNMTKCFYYWDKSSRKIFLFVDNDWSWPVWAWEDDMKLSRFFPYFLIQFYPSTGGVVAPGEASFYLDQQDEINQINAEMRKIRRMVFNVLVYNNNKIKPDDAKKLANYLKNGTGDNILGINVDAGMSIRDAMETLAPPSINYEAVFNKQPIYQSIDRLSSVSDALRGSQLKANTTEDAVQAYVSAAQLRVSNRTDAIEECVQELAWAIAEILVSRATPEDVVGLVGEKNAAAWKSLSVEELNADYSVKVAAGSSEKPTSAFKKKEAIQISQAVGQFARAAPGSTLKVVLKLLQGAFPEVNISEEDWNSIDQEIQANLQRGVSTGGAPQPGAGPGAPSGAGPNGKAGALQQQLESLPPEAKASIMQQIRSGVPPQQALAPFLQGAGNVTPKTKPQ
jgi:hypothetical protein